MGRIAEKTAVVTGGARGIGRAVCRLFAAEGAAVAYGALYLASEEAKFVTGSELVVDGGYTAQ